MAADADNWVQIITIFITVVGTIVPAIWFLSTRIQALAGEVSINTTRIEEKLNSMQEMHSLHREMLKEAIAEQENFRERLAIAEVQVKDLRAKIS